MLLKTTLSLCLALVSIAPAYALDLSITPENVKISGTAGQCHTENVIAGETVTAGQVVRYDEATNEYLKCQNDGSLDEAEAYGIVIQGNAADNPIIIAKEGPIIIGGTMTAGMNLVASANAGGACPPADLAATRYVTSLGHAMSTTVFWVDIKPYRVALP